MRAPRWSNEDTMEPITFSNREHAGKMLADLLEPYRGEELVVLALPRGGVVVAYQVSHALRAPLDVIVARKLGAPFQPEFAVGAIAPNGVKVLEEATLTRVGL